MIFTFSWYWVRNRSGCAFLESPDTLRADFGHVESRCILQTKKFSPKHETLLKLNISYLRDILK